jgi:hypothetical protein
MALNHEMPDRCPMQVSFTPEFANRLREDIRVTGQQTHNPHGGGNTYELERALNQDMLLTSVGWANSYYFEVIWILRCKKPVLATRSFSGAEALTLSEPCLSERRIKLPLDE